MNLYRPIPFKPLRYLKEGGLSRKFTILWLLTCLIVIPSGILTIVLELTGISLRLFGVDLHITIYIPMLICLPMSLIFGFTWGAIPAYIATFFVALMGDMPLHWIVVFACANPIGLAMLVLIYKITPVKINLHSKQSVLVFVVAGFLSSLAGSIGSFIWTYNNQVDLYDFFMVWQGWWLGGFIQAMLIGAPILYFLADRLMAYKLRCFGTISAQTESRRAVKSAIILITLVLIAFTWLAFKVGVMNVIDQVSLVSEAEHRTKIFEAVKVIEFPIMIYIFILAFVGYSVFYFIDYWTLRLGKVNQELQQQNDQLYQLSIRDNLTRVYNRGYLFTYFPELLNRLRREHAYLTLIIIDLDNFKKINDTFGHQAGDHILKQFSAKVDSFIGADQVFVRFGGEEFIMLAPYVNVEQAKKIAKKLNLLSRGMELHFNQQLIQFTISLGVLVTNDYELTADQMIDLSDQALYQAKNNGRDQFVLVKQVKDTD